MSIYEKKHTLYRQYCEELDLFRPIPLAETDAVLDNWCDCYISATNCSWRNIFNEENELVGFLIIGKDGCEKHPHADFGIAQAYVDPNYRKNGLMTQAVNEYIEKHKGIYSVLVIKQNEYALNFWNNLFTKAGYVPHELDTRFVNNEDEELILLGFAPN